MPALIFPSRCMVHKRSDVAIHLLLCHLQTIPETSPPFRQSSSCSQLSIFLFAKSSMFLRQIYSHSSLIKIILHSIYRMHVAFKLNLRHSLAKLHAWPARSNLYVPTCNGSVSTHRHRHSTGPHLGCGNLMWRLSPPRWPGVRLSSPPRFHPSLDPHD